MRLGLTIGYWMMGPEDPIDLDIDSDNTNGLDLPGRTDAEEPRRRRLLRPQRAMKRAGAE
jgi:hypothetical protein